MTCHLIVINYSDGTVTDEIKPNIADREEWLQWLRKEYSDSIYKIVEVI